MRRALARRRRRTTPSTIASDRQHRRHQHDVEHPQLGSPAGRCRGSARTARRAAAGGCRRCPVRAASIAVRCSGVITACALACSDLPPALAQRAQLLLGVVQMRLQRLLGLAELRLGVALHLLRPRERPAGVAARAQPDQRVAAGQRADQVGDERAVVAERRRRSAGRRSPACAPRSGRPGCRCRRPPPGWPGPSVCGACRRGNWPAASGPSPARGGPVNADFSTPRTRAAITRGPPCRLEFGQDLRRIRHLHLIDRDQAGLRAAGQQRRELDRRLRRLRERSRPTRR